LAKNAKGGDHDRKGTTAKAEGKKRIQRNAKTSPEEICPKGENFKKGKLNAKLSKKKHKRGGGGSSDTT